MCHIKKYFKNLIYIYRANPVVNQVNLFFSVALHGLPLPVNLLTVLVSLNCCSSLLGLAFVHPLFVNLFLNSSLYIPQLIQIFD